jgi:uncharacterized membrane protein (UPF0127 family)
MKNFIGYQRIVALACFFLVAVCVIMLWPRYGQPRLPSESLTIVNSNGLRKIFTVELPSTPKEQEAGLMFRRSLAPDAGMLFVFAKPQIVDFWMKNTVLPLDMIFIRRDGIADSIAENAAPYSLANIFSVGPVTAASEVPAGTASRLHLQPTVRVIASQFTAN